MKNDRQAVGGLGVSWGVPGLRFGRSQFGTWWISIGLPFGIRLTRRLGRKRDPIGVPSPVPPAPGTAGLPKSSGKGGDQPAQGGAPSRNQEVLERMRRR